MKIKVFILPIAVEPGVRILHPPSIEVKKMLKRMWLQETSDLQLGRYYEFNLAQGIDPDEATAVIEKITKRDLCNPNIEEYRIETEG